MNSPWSNRCLFQLLVRSFSTFLYYRRFNVFIYSIPDEDEDKEGRRINFIIIASWKTLVTQKRKRINRGVLGRSRVNHKRKRNCILKWSPSIGENFIHFPSRDKEDNLIKRNHWNRSLDTHSEHLCGIQYNNNFNLKWKFNNDIKKIFINLTTLQNSCYFLGNRTQSAKTLFGHFDI